LVSSSTIADGFLLGTKAIFLPLVFFDHAPSPKPAMAQAPVAPILDSYRDRGAKVITNGDKKPRTIPGF
jgi:hypothetical protein